MDSVVTSALVSLGTTWLTRGAKAPAQTLNLLWKVTLGRWDPLMENIVKENVEKYAKDIDNELNKIPPESINPEPDISLIGPALEASKYYVAKEEARQMFAKLIAAELDVTKSDQVHHAFVEIIKQMNPLDAKVLSVIDNPTSLLYCLFPTKDSPDRLQLISDIYISDTFPEYDHGVSLAIGNLSRLGLLDIPTRNMGGVHIGGNDTDIIERFKKTQLFASIEHDVQSYCSPDTKCQITTYAAYLTSMAFSFRTICL
mgnify:CR=1 FL=1